MQTFRPGADAVARSVPASFAAVPALGIGLAEPDRRSGTCMSRHAQIWTSAPMLAPVRSSLAEGRPPAWRRVHNLPA